MIQPDVLDRFLGGVTGQPLREGTVYARQARVGTLTGIASGVSTVVRGLTGDFEVALWAGEGGAEGDAALAFRCACPSWRRPCKHVVAAALVLRQTFGHVPTRGVPSARVVASARGVPAARSSAPGAPASVAAAPEQGSPEAAAEARGRALEERVVAARREPLVVRPAEPPFVVVGSASGFSYRVTVRGGPDGPHGCECPDFEAARLHTCKHVERVRQLMQDGGGAIPAAHRSAAAAPRVYLHLGEFVEPRLLGRPAGPGAPAVREAFDADGVPRRPLARGLEDLETALLAFGRWVEPEALAWVRAQIERRPALPPARGFADLLPALHREPYPFQWEGAEFLARRGRALLADEMGLGKTAQAILAAVALRHAVRPVRAVTVICPASLRGGWEDEIARWLHEDAVLLEGDARARARVVAGRPPWLITHYEQVLRDFRAHAAAPPDLLIIDEAQRAKGLQARTARAIKAIGARHVFALTGTPLENRLEEAYAIAQLVDQRLLPPLWQIDRDHFERDESGRRVVRYRALDTLRARLAPAFLRRRKEDVALQLPEQVRSLVLVPLHAAVAGLYEEKMTYVARIAAKKTILPADIDRMLRFLVIARRCCDGPHMLGMDVADRDVPKLRELEQALRELCLGAGRKVVVFSEWTDMTIRAEALAERLGLPVHHLSGAVPVKERPQLIRAFTEARGPAVFVSTDAGGVGLNLQAADAVINLDLPWNPARLEQRIARVHRIGSRRTVQVLLLVTEGTVEQRILQLYESKRAALANVWAAGGADEIDAPGGSGLFREMVRQILGTRGPAGGGARRVEEGAAKDETRARIRAFATVDPATLTAALAALAPVLPAAHRNSLAVVLRALADGLVDS